MARERHIDTSKPKPSFRLATRLCIMCGCTLLYAIPDVTQPIAWTDDVLDKALESHACQKQVPQARGVWRSR
jgi:transcription elongation factor Elf1